MGHNTNLYLLVLCILTLVGLGLCMYHVQGEFLKNCWPILVLAVVLIPAFLWTHFNLIKHKMQMDKQQSEKLQRRWRNTELPEEKAPQNDEPQYSAYTTLTDWTKGGDKT